MAETFALDRLLRPRSIAIVGASADESGHAGRTVANLVRTGYKGAIYPVNPTRTEIAGLPCHPSINAIDDTVDCAYVMLRADRVLHAVEECVAKRVPVVVVCASGFAEMGPAGLAAQRELGELARSSGTRILGPNCIGALDVVDNVVACPTFNITYSYTPGPVAIVSQSGGMAVNLFNRAQGRRIGIRAMVSVGNEADLGLADLVDAFVDDEQTRTIALFIEQIRDAPAFLRASRRARAAGKAIVALKVGTSDSGSRSVRGHTGAMAGSNEVYRAVLSQAGVLHAASVDELLDTADVIAWAPRPHGNRVVVVSPSGGECSYVADRAERRGLTLPDLAEKTKAALAPHMRLGHPGNPLDPTGQVIGDPALLRHALELVAADDSFDMMAFTIATWGEFDSDRLLPEFIAVAERSTKPVVISAWSAARLTERAEELLEASPVRTYPSSDQAIDALANLWRYWNTPAPNESAAVGAAAPRDSLGQLSEFAVKTFVAEHGIPVSRDVLATDHASLEAALAEAELPVVLKQQARGLLHKSELGLVRVGVRDAEEAHTIAKKFATTLQEYGLDDDGIIVSEQVSGIEMIVGAVRDETFGPVVMIGAGGIHAEVLKDVAFRQCPISPTQARGAIDELGIAAVLHGARGINYNVEALAEIVARLSELLAATPWIEEVELNPVIVRAVDEVKDGRGAVAVDALIRVNDVETNS